MRSPGTEWGDSVREEGSISVLNSPPVNAKSQSEVLGSPLPMVNATFQPQSSSKETIQNQIAVG